MLAVTDFFKSCLCQTKNLFIYSGAPSQVVDKNPIASDGTTPEFLMRRYRLFSEEFKSISPRVDRREQANWNGFEEVKLRQSGGWENTVWWARTPNKTYFYGY